jgi:radical SAM superfamily enzyme YgiQ (UPF0313 family)
MVFVPPIASPIFTEDLEEFHPLGLMALSASLRVDGVDAQIYRPKRALFSDADFQATAEEIAAYGADVVGFSTWCHSYPTSLLLAQAVAKRQPSAAILFGGPQATILDVETLNEFDFVDYVLRGEADYTITAFMAALSGRQPYEEVPGLSYRVNGQVTRNEMAPFVRELDALPLPAYDLYPFNSDFVSLDVGRGCPFKCTFCTTNDFFSKSYRVKSVSRILHEIDFVRRNFNKRKFDFTHDMFTAKRSFVIELCAALSQYRSECAPDLEWSCSARVDCVDDELLAVMSTAGCGGIFFGIETGSPRMQKIVRKHLDLDDAAQVVQDCRRHNIRCTTAFIAGFPEETSIDLDMTLRTILDLQVAGAKPQISLLALLPQTPLFELHKNSLVLDTFFSDFSGVSCGNAEHELIAAHPQMFSSFYYLPVESTSRSTLIAINGIVNLLQRFRGTVMSVWPRVKESLLPGQLLSMIEHFDRRGELGDVETLSALASTLFSSPTRETLGFSEQECAVFTAEAAAALACRRFTSSQVASRVFGRDAVVTPIGLDEGAEQIGVTPWWSVFGTSVPVTDTDVSREGQVSTCGFWYLCVAENERSAVLYPVDDTLLPQLDALKRARDAEPNPTAASLLTADWVEPLHRAGVLCSMN